MAKFNFSLPQDRGFEFSQKKKHLEWWVFSFV